MPVLLEQHLDMPFKSTLPLKACLRRLAVPSLFDVLMCVVLMDHWRRHSLEVECG